MYYDAHNYFKYIVYIIYVHVFMYFYYNCTCTCVSQWGETALTWAADRGYTDIVTVLLEAGANANIQDHVSAHLVRKKSCACVYMYRE